MPLFLISMKFESNAAFQLKNPYILKVSKPGLQGKQPKQPRFRLRKHREQQDVRAIHSMERQPFWGTLPVWLQSCSELRIKHEKNCLK